MTLSRQKSLKVKIARLLQKIDIKFLKFLDSKFQKTNFKSNAPIFIIAPPRSGSTVIYQSLIYSFGFDYVSNLCATFFRYPNIFRRIETFLPKKKINFLSKHGYIDGLRSPAEGKLFWEYWGDHSLQKKSPIHDINKNEYIDNVLRSYNQNLLVCYQGHSFYVEDLRNKFPSAKFIFVEREKGAIISSWVKVEKELNHKFSISFLEENQKFLDSSERINSTLDRLNKLHREQYSHEDSMKFNFDEFKIDPNKYLAKFKTELDRLGIKTKDLERIPDGKIK